MYLFPRKKSHPSVCVLKSAGLSKLGTSLGTKSRMRIQSLTTSALRCADRWVIGGDVLTLEDEVGQCSGGEHVDGAAAAAAASCLQLLCSITDDEP